MNTEVPTTSVPAHATKSHRLDVLRERLRLSAPTSGDQRMFDFEIRSTLLEAPLPLTHEEQQIAALAFKSNRFLFGREFRATNLWPGHRALSNQEKAIVRKIQVVGFSNETLALAFPVRSKAAARNLRDLIHHIITEHSILKCRLLYFPLDAERFAARAK